MTSTWLLLATFLNKRIRKGKGVDELVEKITLLFISIKNKELAQIELYDEEENLLSDELAIAENWKGIANRFLLKK